MHGYRAYIMGPDGHIQDVVEIYIETEEAAKERARQLVDGHAIEALGQGSEDRQI
jgi:hypothetical protein